MRYFIVDAFTQVPFGGNPAGVVLLNAGMAFPSERTMQLLAAEFRYSETAFVRRDGDNEFTMRYFTPQGEVDLCGHATIASFGVLLHEGMVAENTVCLNHTLAGDLEVRAGRNSQIMMQMATARHIDTPIDIDRLHRIMGVEKPLSEPILTAEIISTGLADIIMPVDSVDALNCLNPDMEALALFSCELDVTGVHAFALSSDGFTAHVRNFGPRYGIPEESATGTANGALTHYLYRRQIIGKEACCRFLQGEAMGRPSIVATTMQADGSIYVGGESRIIACGELLDI